MVGFVMAYSFTEDRENDTDNDLEGNSSAKAPPVMVPMADILNHVARNNASLKFEEEALKMVAVKDIKKVVPDRTWGPAWLSNKLLVSWRSLSLPGWLSGERVGLMTWFLSGVFSRLTSAEACGKSSWWLWKESCVNAGVRKPRNTCASQIAMI